MKTQHLHPGRPGREAAGRGAAGNSTGRLSGPASSKAPSATGLGARRRGPRPGRGTLPTATSGSRTLNPRPAKGRPCPEAGGTWPQAVRKEQHPRAPALNGPLRPRAIPGLPRLGLQTRTPWPSRRPPAHCGPSPQRRPATRPRARGSRLLAGPAARPTPVRLATHWAGRLPTSPLIGASGVRHPAARLSRAGSARAADFCTEDSSPGTPGVSLPEARFKSSSRLRSWEGDERAGPPAASEAARPHAPGSLLPRRALGGAHAQAGGGAGVRTLPRVEPGCAGAGQTRSPTPWRTGLRGPPPADAGEEAVPGWAGSFLI